MNEQDTPRDDSQPPTALGNNSPTEEVDFSSERRDRQQQHARRRHPRGGGGNRDSQPRQENRSSSNVASAINMNELREVVELISQHGFSDFEFEREGFRVRLRKGFETQQSNVQFAAPPAFASPSSTAAAPPVAPPTSTPTTQAEANSQTASSVSAASPDTDLHVITSPIVGTFYRAASPTSEPFVKVGDTIESSTTVCIVEAMKLMNEIPAETSGTIEKIYVENAQPVEYGQPLFGIKK